MATLFEADEPWSAPRLPSIGARIAERLQEVADRLAEADWFAGSFSPGDLMMGSVLRMLEGTPLLEAHPRLATYVARGIARPTFRRALRDHLAGCTGAAPGLLPLPRDRPLAQGGLNPAAPCAFFRTDNSHGHPMYPDADDPASLDRFLAAQDELYEQALSEIRRGRKQSHWMWFIFPQLRGLGRSATAEFFGLAGLAEARDYLAHPVLGPRLVTCAETVLRHKDVPAEAVMGGIDAMKLRSCATLFAAVTGGGDVFEQVNAAFFGGKPCGRTLALLAGAAR